LIVKTHLVSTEILLASLYYKELEVERNDLGNYFFLKTAILDEAHFIEENISSFSSCDLVDLSLAKQSFTVRCSGGNHADTTS